MNPSATIATSELQPEAYYWARRLDEEQRRIVQVSTVFGVDLEHLTVAVMSSDQHHLLADFEFLAMVPAFEIIALK